MEKSDPVVVTDGGTSEAADDHEKPDDTSADSAPSVELELYQLSVSVTGKSADDLSDVEESAVRLLEELVDTAEQLEDSPDGRGLG